MALRFFRSSTVLIPILLLALALRLAPWGHNRFLEDEALYAYWGLRIATGTDPMLNYEPVDKPPLHPYLLALSFRLLGRNETAARLPSLLASMTGVALVYALGRTLTSAAGDKPVGQGSALPVGDKPEGCPTAFSSGKGRRIQGEEIGLLAALLLALSPFDILFASTAFTDPLMTAWMLAALLAAAQGHWGRAGLLSGLAAATKQQGLFFLPLVVAVGVERTTDAPSQRIKNWQTWARFAAGLGLVVAGVLWWDTARLQRPGFFQQSLISYGRLGPVQPQALGERAVGWLRLVGMFWVSPWFNGLLIVALAWWLCRGRKLRVEHWTLGIFILSFLLMHWLIGFQVWDRYLLGLIPLLALLAAWAFADLASRLAPNLSGLTLRLVLGAVLIALLAGPVMRATRSEIPVGGDHGAYDGIDDLAAYVRVNVPAGAVLYHHWLGYHYRFYLYGAPLRLHWYPDPADLAHDARVYRREPRYIAFPSFRESAPMEAALAEAGIHLLPVFQTTRRDGTVSFRLYRLEGP